MRHSVDQETLFSLLPKARTPWGEFLFSTGAQAVAIAFLAWVRLLYPMAVSTQDHTFRSIQLVNTPVPVNHTPQSVADLPNPQPRPQMEDTSAMLRLPALQPKLVLKKEVHPAPVVNIAARKLEPLSDTAPVIPKQAVRTNVFSTGSSATPTIAHATSQVQTGGFGDPNGIPARSGQGKPVTIAALGSSDLAFGPGYGNGTRGAKGASGVVASTGFGNGTATGKTSGPAPARAIQPSGFASMDVPAAPTVRSRSAESASQAIPAEILSKPVPAYTQEAKSLRIEGEVLLEAVLEASGGLRVVRVVRGLGHGLDDNAVKAAQQIHFKPAIRNGQPADSTVVLHIIFQLA